MTNHVEFNAGGMDSFSSDQLPEVSGASPRPSRGPSGPGTKRRGGPGGGRGPAAGRGPRAGQQAPAAGGQGGEEVLKDFESVAAKADEPGFIEKVIQIKRVTKVTKGGKKMSFTALVVVGDAKGRVGFNLSRGSEVSLAIRKALNTAKRNMLEIPVYGSTIPHEVIGSCGASQVLLKPASKGTGVIAAGPVRAVCDGAGIHDILSKCHRSNNPINVIKATFDGLSQLKKVSQSQKEESQKG